MKWTENKNRQKRAVIAFICLVIIIAIGNLWAKATNNRLTSRDTRPPTQQTAEKSVVETKDQSSVNQPAQSSAGTGTLATQPQQEEVKQPALYNIVSVTDGDTIKVNINGATTTLRLIGIDTPETVDPRKAVQCFGREASNKAKEILNGKKVRLEADSTQGEFDKYNRLLRYVYVEDGTFFNKYMISEGYAHEYTYNIPYKFQTDFKDAETRARAQSKGLWSPSTCNGDTEQSTALASGDNVPTGGSSTATSGNNQCLIKGNISSSKEKIYHVPDGAYYDKTSIDESKGERWFCTESEAVSVGWRKSLR